MWGSVGREGPARFDAADGAVSSQGRQRTDPHWFFDPLTKQWGRFDGKFYTVAWEAEPYGRPFINEEPMVPEPEIGPRIVGHIGGSSRLT